MTTLNIGQHLLGKPLPRTLGWPLVGSLPRLLRDPFRFLIEARARYGDIYELNLGLNRVVILNHPRHAQHIFRDNAANYRKGGAMWDTLRVMLGNGLVVSEGDYWLRQRRMIQPHFHRQRIAMMAERMLEAIDESLAEWPEKADAFNAGEAMSPITMNVILKTMFGVGLEAEEMNRAGEAITYTLNYLMLGAVTESLPGWLPIPGRQQNVQARQTFDEIIYRLIERKREAKIEDGSLLSMLMDTVDEETNAQMTAQELRDEVATFFAAGYDTTSIALAWTVHFLTREPEVVEKLEAEIKAVVGDRRPTVMELRQMPYSRMVLQESMRLRPSSWLVPRTAVTDDVIDGYHVPAGRMLLSLSYMYHRHPEQWHDPDRFDPERFTPERMARRHNYAWSPFGGGQRMCIGKEFALMEGQLALIRMVQQFRMTAVPGREVKPQLSGTLRPKGGVWVQLQRK